MTPEHWGPLALQDHGPEPLVFDATCPRGLIGANFAFRRRIFDCLGEFSPAVQRVKDGVGSTEDHEMVQRLHRRGRPRRLCPQRRGDHAGPARANGARLPPPLAPGPRPLHGTDDKPRHTEQTTGGRLLAYRLVETPCLKACAG